MTATSWIGVDLDGTLADAAGGWISEEHIGEPVPRMVERVKKWLEEGRDVRIFTARVGITYEYSPFSRRYADPTFTDHQRQIIGDWCERHIGRRLPVTAQKDFNIGEIWDDRAVRVEWNTGEVDNGYTG